MGAIRKKAAIPRLAHQQGASVEKRRRTGRACDPCRHRKVKCHGGRPTCHQCRTLHLQCHYSDTKRAQEHTLFSRATEKLSVYEELLGDLLRSGDEFSRRRIVNALKSSGLELPSPNVPGNALPSNSSSPSSTSQSSSAGSLEAIDVVGEDLNRSEESRATGYIGKNSEISWLRGLEERNIENDQGEEGGETTAYRPMPQGLNNASVSSVSYHLDDCHLPDSEYSGSPWDLPARETANKILQSYWDSVNPSFPIIRRNLFSQQVNNLYSMASTTDKPSKQWLAILNLVFAIGSKFRQATGLASPSDVHHEVFFSRAKALSIGDNVLFEHADLQQTQVESLAAFYFLCMGQINRFVSNIISSLLVETAADTIDCRAWRMVGVAIRSAIALGLNLRTAPKGLNPVSIEVRTRTWSSIFYLEHLLTTMTSRVSCLGEGSSTHYPPLPFGEDLYDLSKAGSLLEDSQYREAHIYWTMYQNEEQARNKCNILSDIEHSSSQYFYYLIDLATITNSVTNRVYNPAAVRDGWEQIHQRITLHRDKIDAWVLSLSPRLQFLDQEGNPLPDITDPFQISLALNYFSSLMILTRPCLTINKASAEQPSYMANPSSADAQTCLYAAKALISILAEQPETVWISKVLPWWCVLHYLVRATTVLLINLKIGLNEARSVNTRSPEIASSGKDMNSAGVQESILESLKRALRWLHALGTNDESSRRAFHICNRLFLRMVPSGDSDKIHRYSQQQFGNAPFGPEGAASQQHQYQTNEDDFLTADEAQFADVFSRHNAEWDWNPASGESYQTLFSYTDMSMEMSPILDFAQMSTPGDLATLERI